MEKVRITIHSTQHDISDESTSTTYIGNCHMRNGRYLIAYKEFPTDGDSSQAVSSALLKIDSHSVHLTKKGAVTTQMSFEKGKKHQGIYQTPFGSFSMALDTEDLHIEKQGRGVSASIVYRLRLNQAAISRYTIHIETEFL